jgi:hypothetical protein
MRNILQDADRDRLVAPLALLATEVACAGRNIRALPEAEGSVFFPAAATAPAAELLHLPGLRDAHAPLADALLDALMALAGAPAGMRAVAGMAELLRDDPADLLVRTPHHRLTGDLRAGVLRQEPPGGGRPALRHTGNLVEFRIGRHAACVDVEDNITEASVTREDGRIILTHAGTIRGLAGLFTAREVEAGRIEYRYEIDPATPVLRVEVRFTATRALSRLRVTTALDAVAEEGAGGTAARLMEGGAWRDALPPAAAGAERWARGAPVAHLAVGAAGWPAGAPAAHLRPQDPARVLSVTAQAQQGGEVHWLLLRHGPVDLAAGQTLVVREDRLLAPGRVETVAATMAAGLPAGLAPDPRPDPGAALRAVAAALLFEAGGGWANPLPTPRRAALLAFAEDQVARLSAMGGVAELASAVLGADSLRRAGRSGQDALPALARRLAGALEAAPADLGARALVMLALARSATWTDAAAAAEALPGLLEGIGASAPGTAPALMLGGERLDPLAEAEGVAMLARAVGAVALAANAGAPIPPVAVAKARELHRITVALLRPLVRPREGRLEVHGPHGLAPGLQALLALGFMAPERLVFTPA